MSGEREDTGSSRPRPTPVAPSRGGEGERPVRVQLSRDQIEQLFAESDQRKARLAAEMPTEHDALKVLFSAYQRLKQLGWNDAIYCPKDGTVFDAIEVGSTGIHKCHYEGKWPNGRWWIAEAGDLWPSRPCLYRTTPQPPDPQVPDERSRDAIESKPGDVT